MDRLLQLFLVLMALGLFFGLLERLFRTHPGPAWFRRPDTHTDLAYWFFTPLVTRSVTRLGVALGVVLLVLLSGGSLAEVKADVAAGNFPDLGVFGFGEAIRSLPLALQIPLGLMAGDFLGYWIHRAFHRGRLWSFHSVHHSSPRLDWLSSVRLHPVNDLVSRVLQAVPLLLLGFDPLVFALYAPITTVYALLLHADVNWSFGPARFLLASPLFHRWHHSSQAEGRDKNFAGLFPLYDIAFGTYYFPHPGGSVKERLPLTLGTPETSVPAGFWRQLVFPFQRRPTGKAPLASEV